MLAAFADERAFGPTGRPQSPDIEEWSATHRVVGVAEQAQPQVLEIAENFNPGWRADLAGVELQSVRVDGWKQGFLVPAGAGGQVSVDYAPDSTYRWGLAIGLLAALAVVYLAVRPPALRVRPSVASRPLRHLVAALVGIGVLLTMGPWGVLALGVGLVLVRRLPLPVVAFTSVTVAVVLAAVAGIRPGSAVVVLQGLALALAWAAVLWAGWRGPDEARPVAMGNVSSAAPDAR